jgi:hypothetical protein
MEGALIGTVRIPCKAISVVPGAVRDLVGELVLVKDDDGAVTLGFRVDEGRTCVTVGLSAIAAGVLGTFLPKLSIATKREDGTEGSRPLTRAEREVIRRDVRKFLKSKGEA